MTYVHIYTPDARRGVQHCRTCKRRRRCVLAFYYDAVYVQCAGCGDDPRCPPARFKRVSPERASRIRRAKQQLVEYAPGPKVIKLKMEAYDTLDNRKRLAELHGATLTCHGVPKIQAEPDNGATGDHPDQMDIERDAEELQEQDA